MNEITEVRDVLLKKYAGLANKADILKDSEFKLLYKRIKDIPENKRAEFGKSINDLRLELINKIEQDEQNSRQNESKIIDISAPFDINVEPSKRPRLLPAEFGSAHPLMTELDRVIDIFTRMGFEAIESRQLDDDYHMFTSLNFPPDHPARDDYDTFKTEEGLIPPAHTSTMQHRILRSGISKLESGQAIAAISYGRVYRNEDVDATHEHTFYQVEGVYVSESATLGQMLGVLRSFFETYYSQQLKIKTQPSYFPFVEPGLEFAIEKPVALGGKKGEWLEMLGCGMIHPNVLKDAGIDPVKYHGFAWGGGLERLVMLAHGIEDLRHFESGKLSFLRKFI